MKVYLTIPTLWVLVRAIGQQTVPISSIQAIPVISPFPFSVWTPMAMESLSTFQKQRKK
jgi:hypothetical protein